MPTCFIYVRVSTDEQHFSPEWQQQVCLNYFETGTPNNPSPKSRGFTLGGIVEDIGQSAYKIDLSERRNGRAMFQSLQKGDLIVAAKQDRLWRRSLDKEKCCFYFTQMGIAWCALDVMVDTSTASGAFASGIIALQSQWESATRSERMFAYNKVRRSRKTPRRRFPPAGWKRNEHDELVPDADERKLIKLLWKWREQGVRSLKASCRWLTDEGVRRHCGTKYTHDWLIRNKALMLKGFPMEGYCQTWWRSKEIPEEEKAQCRSNRINPRGQAPSAGDLRWLSAAYSISLSESSSPASRKPRAASQGNEQTVAQSSEPQSTPDPARSA
jgi:DNA invertase Pin-like site-specific DNA recombinase